MNLPGPRVRLSVDFCEILIIRTPGVSLQRVTDGKVCNDESRKVYVVYAFKLSAFDNILILTHRVAPNDGQETRNQKNHDNQWTNHCDAFVC